MANLRRSISSRWWYKRAVWFFVILVSFLGVIRWNKGTGLIDTYSLLIRPFGPAASQKDWIKDSHNLQQKMKIDLLEKDNQRLRLLLSLQNSFKKERVSAAVIARQTNGWWQQIVINKGLNYGIQNGSPVLGPGGLLGIIENVSLTTSKVRLLTSPGSNIGVWVQRIKGHGMLIGMGTNRTKLTFLDKDPQVKPGDLVSTSPASSILPPNLPIGVVQTVEPNALPAPYATVQLIASPEAIDWVQVLK